MDVVIDCNLSKSWIAHFAKFGIHAVHWYDIGSPKAADEEIMLWARERGYIVFTYDLDMGTILAHNKDKGPSVIQIRGDAIMPNDIGDVVVHAMLSHSDEIDSGAILTIREDRTKIRILPIK